MITIELDLKLYNSWDLKYMKSALLFSEESKCAAKHVCCILVKDKNIISMGINGTAPNAENCYDKYKKLYGLWFHVTESGYKKCENQEEHHEWSLLHEVHAEINALGKASKLGISTNGATAYITHSPCHDCAKALAVAGIHQIYYVEAYDNVDQIKSMLMEDFHVNLIQIPKEKLEGELNA